MNKAVDLHGVEMVVMTAEEYATLVEDAGDAAIFDYVRQTQDPEAPGMPTELAQAVDNGLHPLAAWRQAVGFTQAALAEKAGVRAATISDIEGRRIDPRLSTLKALATALHLGIEDIVD